MNFKKFSEMVSKEFQKLQKEAETLGNETLWVAKDVEKLWQVYLEAFPEGTNPIYCERAEHDCNTCKQFIRQGGGVMYISGGIRHTIWDNFEKFPAPYDVVGRTLCKFLQTCEVEVYQPVQNKFGALETKALSKDKVVTFNHFEGKIIAWNIDSAKKSYLQSNLLSWQKFLEEASEEIVQDILDLVEDKQIYRGEEWKEQLKETKRILSRYKVFPEKYKKDFAYSLAKKPCIRSTVMGTLIKDLADGTGIEDAVKAFESKVAPENYKRPAPVFTKRQKEEALKTIDKLGLRESLKRRHAHYSDIALSEIIWANETTQHKLKDDLVDLLIDFEKPVKKVFKAPAGTEIKIEEFISSVLPEAEEVQIKIPMALSNNFVNLIAPEDTNAPTLFSWGNNFSWSYIGGLGDSSIKQKVKQAGGATDKYLRISLAWFTRTDLDIHCKPSKGQEISYTNKQKILDVDMNVRGESKTPVENLAWSKEQLQDGHYKVFVNNYKSRSSQNNPFIIEIEYGGAVWQMEFSRYPAQRGNKTVLEFDVKNGEVFFDSSSITQKVWGVQLNQFVPVNMITHSPNYWEGAAKKGNRHYLFLIDECKNPDDATGFMNEFLRTDLQKHRRVFAALSESLRVPYSDEQVAGIGVSSTKSATFEVRVKSRAGWKIYKIVV